jgi:hypothetical protein
MGNDIAPFDPNRGTWNNIIHPLDSFRDSKIKAFFRQAGISTDKLTDDDQLHLDEIPTDNPRAKMLTDLFNEYAKGKNYLSPDDLAKFINATKGGTVQQASNINIGQAQQYKDSGLEQEDKANPYSGYH